MKCNEFRQLIPDIIDRKIPDENLAEVVSHLAKCKECYDELEIFYILQYGLSEEDDNDRNMDFIGDLERRIREMNKRSVRFRRTRRFKRVTFFTAEGAVLLALFYMTMNYFI